MMWRPSSHLSQWTLPSSLSGTSWNRTHNCIKEPPCWYNTSQHYWSYALNTPISPSEVSIMNRCIGQPGESPIVQLPPTCSWKSLKPKPSTLPPILQRCGSSTWMTLLSSKRQNKIPNFYSTSTPLTLTFNSPKKLQTQMDSFHFWTLLFNRTRQYLAHYSLQKTYKYTPVPTLG